MRDESRMRKIDTATPQARRRKNKKTKNLFLLVLVNNDNPFFLWFLRSDERESWVLLHFSVEGE